VPPLVIAVEGANQKIIKTDHHIKTNTYEKNTFINSFDCRILSACIFATWQSAATLSASNGHQFKLPGVKK
jgi:hypothetical protein